MRYRLQPRFWLYGLLCWSIIAFGCQPVVEPAVPPNVILLITDDQGYGDIGAHGNTLIDTPNLDQLWSESVRLTNFHVDPTCSPSRSALMTGRYSSRTGVWHTIMGRSLMAPEEETLAEVFKAGGYHTGMIGKWHLGDNYPLRPMDQGFDEAIWHKGGGVGQGPDYWGNDYFDDTYWRGTEPESFDGYCTDVWFSEASAFIDKNKDAPFFLYLSTNAAHGPYLVDPKYSEPYAAKGAPAPLDAYYGMITNIDENVGRLRAHLETLGLAENTIFIFMTDNGTSSGEPNRQAQGDWSGFNAGMRGIKGSEYEGGHRVPFYIYWPAGGLTGARDVDQLTAHIDILPTLVDLVNLKPPASLLDGTSLQAVLARDDANALRDRTLIVHSQRVEHPQKWRKSSVMTDRWRLVNRDELYDLDADPSQAENVAEVNPDVVASLQSAYNTWWESLTPGFDDYVRIVLGNAAENPVRLMSHDWHTDNGAVPWHQVHVQNGLAANGFWAVDVEEAGDYAITLYRWPAHLNRPMDAVEARLELGDVTASMRLDVQETAARLNVSLAAGPGRLQTWLKDTTGEEYGAYFVHVEKL